MKLNKLEIIKILKDKDIIQSENDVAEIKSNGLGSIFIRLNDKVQNINLKGKRDDKIIR